MRQVTVNVYSYEELSKAAKEVVKHDFSDFIQDSYYFIKSDVEASYKAFMMALSNCDFTRLKNSNDCILTGCTYDLDFTEILKATSIRDEIRIEAKKVLRNILARERRYVYSVDYLNDLFEGHEIEFLSSGKQFLDGCKG